MTLTGEDTQLHDSEQKIENDDNSHPEMNNSNGKKPSCGGNGKETETLPEENKETGSSEATEKDPLRSEEEKDITVEINDVEGQAAKDAEAAHIKKGLNVRWILFGILMFALLAGAALVAILANKYKVEPNHRFQFAGYFGDNMVLQRAPQRAVVWGYGSASTENSTVTVSIKGQDISKTYSAVIKNTAGGQIWKVLLDKIEEAGPFAITAQLENSKIEINNVLFGDVWICAGQENMDFSVDQLMNSTEELNDLQDHQQIRLFSVPTDRSGEAQYSFRRRHLPWLLPHKESVARASSICWLFGKQLHSKLKYPIGLVSATYPDSLIEDWVPAQAMNRCAPSNSHRSGHVWNSMIHPLLDMSMYGLIWYQGEKDALDGLVHNYNCSLVEFISQWRGESHRRSWGATDPTFPVGIVQLAPHRDSNQYTYGFTDIRWRQTANYGYLPNDLLKKTYLATAVDLPDVNSTHGSILPRHKHVIANRLFVSTLAIAYQQKDIHYQAPFPAEYSISLKDHVLKLYFKPSDIVVRNDTGFEVCCSDNKTLFCPSSSFSKVTVSFAPGREWIPTPINSSSTNSVSLSFSTCESPRHVVGLRYLWRETPCQLQMCPIYGTETDLPMLPYIRFGLQDDGLTHQIRMDQVNLI